VWWGDSLEPVAHFYFRELYYVPGRQWFARDGYVLNIDGQGNLRRLALQDAKPPFGDSLDFTPQTILASQVSDYDALSMAQLQDRISRLRANPQRDPESYRSERDLQVGYWTKVSLPLSALVFALVGAPVSIRRVRQSVGVGVGISILVIFVYYLVHNYMTILAKGGKVAPAVSAFLPVALGVIVAWAMLRKKNV
jgi:lipopolysaccharide export system permease protein